MSNAAQATQAFNEAKTRYCQSLALTAKQQTIFSRGTDAERYLESNFLYVSVNAKLRVALLEVLLRMPDHAFDLLTEKRRVVFVQPDRRTSTVYPPNPERGWFLILQSDTDAMVLSELVGLIAHELAHVALKHFLLSDASKSEREADELASAWGFAEEIRACKKVTITHGQGL